METFTIICSHLHGWGMAIYIVLGLIATWSVLLNVLEIDSEIQEQYENLVLANSEQTNQRVSMHQAGTTHTVHLTKTVQRNLKLEARKY